MTRTHMTVLLAGGLLVGLTACGSNNHTTVSSIAPETSAVATSEASAVSTTVDPATTTATTAATTASSVVVNGVSPSTTVDPAPKPDLSSVLALVDSAEKSAASVDKELSTANNAMNTPEQDPQS